jgi:tRNA threonylcarbamoyladenosine biosynthesis protein TsaB
MTNPRKRISPRPFGHGDESSRAIPYSPEPNRIRSRSACFPVTPPPYTVGLETSGQIGSVALLRGDALIGERKIGDSGRRHARTLISELDELLKTHGVAPKSVDHVAVSIGPGSFTGLRVGIVAAKTWGYVTGAKLTAVGTFEAVAATLPVTASTAWIIDNALRGEIFVQKFQPDHGRWRATEPPRIAPLDYWLAGTTPGDVVSGPAASKWPDDATAAKLAIAPIETHRPTAAMIARCGLEKARAGEFTDPFTLIPLYIRRSAAEEKLDALTAAGPKS